MWFAFSSVSGELVVWCLLNCHSPSLVIKQKQIFRVFKMKMMTLLRVALDCTRNLKLIYPFQLEHLSVTSYSRRTLQILNRDQTILRRIAAQLGYSLSLYLFLSSLATLSFTLMRNAPYSICHIVHRVNEKKRVCEKETKRKLMTSVSVHSLLHYVTIRL